MDTRLPYFDGQKDFQVYLRFLDNRKEFDAYDKKLSERIAAFNKAVKLYGKAKDIEKLHEQAELLAVRAEGAFTEREETLKTGEAKFKKASALRLTKLDVLEQKATEKQRLAGLAIQATTAALDAREVEVGKRENAIMAREKRAQEAQEAAQGAKDEADAMVGRMKAATAPAAGVA